MNRNNLKVLLVDDADFFREVMCDYFQRTPVDILTATSGQQAIDLAMREWPDLIYMDVSMPDMNGIEACRRLKDHPALKKIPVLLIFTPGRDATMEDVEDSGCDGYLVKPFGREDFLTLGHRHLFNLERRERRVSCQMTVDFTINHVTHQGCGVDISRHGLYIEFREEVPLGSPIRARFMLPTISAEYVEVSGRVTWVNRGFPRQNLTMPQGFGMEIQTVDRKSVEIIRAYLEVN